MKKSALMAVEKQIERLGIAVPVRLYQFFSLARVLGANWVGIIVPVCFEKIGQIANLVRCRCYGLSVAGSLPEVRCPLGD